ncbi:NACHT domain-containing protein [Amycolatopsis sp. NPDC051102]|uniref:NACHT domain-containing protein n=1 Tax=Amycolatopsis sp. NPDC051102 TaxID=3155163 RepID=UPI00342B73A9
MPISKQRRRLLLRLTIASAIVIAGVVAFVLFTSSLDENDAYSSIVGVLCSIITSFTGIVIFLRRPEPELQVDAAAKDLADKLLQQWDREIRHRREQFGDGRAIPLTWKEAPGLAADPAAVFGITTPVGTVRPKLDGRLDDNPDEAARKLAEAFEQIPSQRLVVIGDPGSGKTYLGITLTTGLLRRWSPGKPVPVFLSLSSWDPVTESLDTWLVRELAITHYGGQEQIPGALLVQPRLLPVLDGLDELPEHLRRSAIAEINKLLEGNFPLVLTCRSVEYTDEIRGGAPKLLRAPVVEIRPIDINDIVTQLEPDAAWAETTSYIKKEPTSPFAVTLGTPLMLSLFKSAYAGHDPAELRDQTKFDTRHAVEDHLIDTMIRTAYSGDASNTPRWRRWSGEQAWRWLSYLANYLHKHNDRDLKWWQLAPRTLSPWVAVAVALPVGFAAVLATAILDRTALEDGSTTGLVSIVLGSPSIPGVVFGTLAAALWLVGARQTAERRHHAQVHGWKQTGRAAVTGAALAFLPCVLLWLTSADDGTAESIVESTTLFGAILAISLIAGAAVGTPELLHRRRTRTKPPDPFSLLRQERFSALLSAMTAMVIVATTVVLATTLTAALAGHLGERIALLFDRPSVVDLHLPPVEDHVPWELGWLGLPSLIAISVLLGVLFAMAILTTRPWPRFAVARLRLAFRRELPWQLMRFLADARRRGLLRVAGGSYQFWHVRLQERLVAAPHPPARRWSRLLTYSAVGLVALAAGSFVVSVVSVEPAGCRRVHIGSLDDRMQRTVNEDVSGCFATLTEEDWPHLALSPADRKELADIGINTSKQYKPATLLPILGELDRISTSEWSQIVSGLTKARKAIDAPISVTLIEKDTGDLKDVDSNMLSAEYIKKKIANPSYLSTIDLDNTQSDVSSSTINYPIIATSNLDFHAIVDSYRDGLIAAFLTWTIEYPSPPIITDGISDEECSTLHASTAGYPLTFDLRQMEVTAELVHRLDECGGASAIVANDQVAALREMIADLPTVGFFQIDDKSQGILEDCGVSVEPKSTAARVCVAAVAGVAQFRTTIRSISENSSAGH